MSLGMRPILGLLLVMPCLCLESAMVGVLGYGTLIVLVLIVVAFLIGVVSRGSDYSEFITIAGSLLPLSAFLFFYLVPKENDYLQKQKKNTKTDNQMVVIIISFVLIFLSALGSSGMVFLAKFRQEHYAVRVITTDNSISKQEPMEQPQLAQLAVQDNPSEEQQRFLS